MSRENLPAAASARALLRETAAGVLASHSVAVAGYPLGSLVPFVLTPEGRPVFYISRIAQHTKNLQEDARVSLTATVADLTGTRGDPQAAGRVSVLGDASPLAGADLDAARARYETFFPESAGHSDVHDFDYWQIEPVRVRYIGGFGAIHWVEADEFCLPRMEWQDGEAGIVKHMNEDHRDAMGLIWQRQEGGRPNAEGEGEPTMLASDPEGFHMRWGQQTTYVRYAKRCETALDVRKEMVRLTKDARSDAS
jgi:putative heme iron utilization protein